MKHGYGAVIFVGSLPKKGINALTLLNDRETVTLSAFLVTPRGPDDSESSNSLRSKRYLDASRLTLVSPSF